MLITHVKFQTFSVKTSVIAKLIAFNYLKDTKSKNVLTKWGQKVFNCCECIFTAQLLHILRHTQ